MNYTRINEKERHFIETMLKENKAIHEIARFLARSPSSISREIRRNRGRKGYRHKQAASFSLARAQSKSVYMKLTDDMVAYIIAHLRNKWSPEQIAGYCLDNGIAMIGKSSIYSLIWQDKYQGGEIYKLLTNEKKAAAALQ